MNISDLLLGLAYGLAVMKMFLVPLKGLHFRIYILFHRDSQLLDRDIFVTRRRFKETIEMILVRPCVRPIDAY